MKRFFKFLLRMILYIAAFLAIGCVFLYFGQDKLLFFPRSYGADAKLTRDRYHVVEFDTPGDGLQKAYYLGPNGAFPEKLWILTGGNGSLALGWDFVVTPAAQSNPHYGYLLIEYPGYGESGGKPSRVGIQKVVVAAIESLATEIGTDSQMLRDRSSFLGHSLGAAVAFETAAEWGRGEVIALAPFTSIKAMAGRMVGPLSFLARNRWDNEVALEKLSKIEGAEVMICHGASDEIIPVEMGRALKAAFPDMVRFFEYPRLRHNNIGYELRDQLVKQLAR